MSLKSYQDSLKIYYFSSCMAFYNFVCQYTAIGLGCMAGIWKGITILLYNKIFQKILNLQRYLIQFFSVVTIRVVQCFRIWKQCFRICRSGNTSMYVFPEFCGWCKKSKYWHSYCSTTNSCICFNESLVQFLKHLFWIKIKALHRSNSFTNRTMMHIFKSWGS